MQIYRFDLKHKETGAEVSVDVVAIDYSQAVRYVSKLYSTNYTQTGCEPCQYVDIAFYYDAEKGT